MLFFPFLANGKMLFFLKCLGQDLEVGIRNADLTKHIRNNYIFMAFQAALEVVLAATLVEKIKETVIMMANARKITNVEPTIAEVHSGLNLFMIVALVQKKIYASLKILVELIKVIVIQMLNVRMDLSVD